MTIDFSAINNRLLQQAQELLPQWLPGGSFKGQEYVTGSLAGGPGSSLSVNSSTGQWADFATGEKGGDLVSLYAAIHGIGQAEAARRLVPDQAGSSEPRGATIRPAAEQKAPKAYATAEAALQALTARLGDFSNVWAYHNAQGEEIGHVFRWDTPQGKKEIRPITRTPAGWICGGMPEPRPLYRLPDLLQASKQRVYVVEGEKSAEAGRDLGLLTTTSPHGSQSARKADWSPLAGRDVVILPDNDEAGEKYAQDVARLLMAQRPLARVKILRLPGLEDGGDLADYVRDNRIATAADIEALADAAEAWRPPARPAERGAPRLICMADVEPEEIRWLWPGRIPLGRMTLLVGRPGEGKSFLTAFLAAQVSRGGIWPDGPFCEQGSVVLCSAEDDPADTIAPRLMAHDADRKRIHLLSGVMTEPDKKGQASERVFTLADLDALRQTLEQIPDCRLIVVDPIGSYLGGQADAHKDNEVRSVLAPACKLAAEYGAALVVVAHTRKSAAAHADDMAMGSRAFTGLARSVLHLLVDPDDESKRRRLLLPGKNNLTEPPAGLAFDIGPGLESLRPRVRWHEGTVDITADEAVNREPAGGEERQSPALSEAVVFLRQALAAGSRPSKDVLEQAREVEGIAEKTLRRARKQAGVDVFRPENPGPWWWRLRSADPTEQMAICPTEN